MMRGGAWLVRIVLAGLCTRCTVSVSDFTGADGVSSNAYTKWVDTMGSKQYAHSKIFHKQARSDNTGISSKSNIELTKDPAVTIYWTIDSLASKICLAIVVKAIGWMGLGFTEMGGMSGSDMLIFEASSHSLLDAYATSNGRPKIDDHQDWTLVNSIVEDGFIIVEAERNLDTGDPMDWPIYNDSDPLLPGTKVIAAWGDTDEMQYHGSDDRLQGTVRFFSKPGARDDEEIFKNSMTTEAAGSIVLKVDKFQLPHRWPTWYEHRCFTVTQLAQEQNLPLDSPLHLLGFEWLLDPGDHVHHIALYSSPSEHISKCDETGPHSFMHVWNKGQDKHYFLPSDVGVLLADESKGSKKGLGRIPKSFRLEVHYENPKKSKGLKDSSGVRLHFTSALRKHTAAIMEFADPRVLLVGKPIGEGLQRHRFSCPDSCTTNHIEENGVTVLYEMLHMHTHGLTMHNIQKRDGKEIRRSTVQYFDFNQGAQIVKQDRFEILPGDSFDTLCHYSGDKQLAFGFEFKREMCMAWLLYYPAADIHLSCSFRGEEDGCAAEYSSEHLSNDEHLGRTFGVTSDLVVDATKQPIPKKVEQVKPIAGGSFGLKSAQRSIDSIGIVAVLCFVCAAFITVLSARAWQRRVRNDKKLRTTNTVFDRGITTDNPEDCNDSERRLCPVSSGHTNIILRRRGVPADV